MTATLRRHLLGLVLLNLAFVQLTGAVGASWLVALWAAAAIAPLVVRWQERPWFRGTWNGAVLVSFAFLVRDALTSGLLHMLEDGLLLAALCQVHLLHNIGQRQRPDLLFFNSFLIAFVTSFFCGDAAWSICFVGYAALLVPALQLFIVLPRALQPDPAAVRAIVRNSLPRAAATIAITAAVFAVWPRDFHRDGWIGDSLHLGGQSVVAFAEEIRLDRRETPTLSDAPVMTLRADGGAATLPTHWRGATFVQFDGAGWQPLFAFDPGSRSATDAPWQAIGQRHWRRAGTAGGAAIELRLLDRSGGRLFLPLDACAVEVTGTGVGRLDPRPDGVIAFAEFAPGDGELFANVQVGRAVAPDGLPARSRTLLQQLPRRLPQALVDLAGTLRRELPDGADDAAIAAHAQQWLLDHRRYALPGTPGAARNLGEFLIGTGGGHCEYFATTLALLLRLQNVPCRVVGGYLAHEPSGRDGIVVRMRDAHAWVEAWLPSAGWTTLDATPPTDRLGDAGAASWWQAANAWLQGLWQRVTSFGDAERKALFAWLLALPGSLLRAAVLQPWWPLSLGALYVWLRRRRRRSGPPPTVLALRSALRRARVAPVAGETPRELLERARLRQGTSAAIDGLADAVAAHERARYAP